MPHSTRDEDAIDNMMLELDRLFRVFDRQAEQQRAQFLELREISEKLGETGSCEQLYSGSTSEDDLEALEASESSENDCSSMEVCDCDEDLEERKAALDFDAEDYNWDLVSFDQSVLLAGLNSAMDAEQRWGSTFAAGENG